MTITSKKHLKKLILKTTALIVFVAIGLTLGIQPAKAQSTDATLFVSCATSGVKPKVTNNKWTCKGSEKPVLSVDVVELTQNYTSKTLGSKTKTVYVTLDCSPGSVSDDMASKVCTDGATAAVTPKDVTIKLNPKSDTGFDVIYDGSTVVGAAGGGSTSDVSSIDSWLQATINLLSGLVGIVIVISIIVAGIQYMTAGSNASQVSAAKNRISMAVLSFILFAFAYTILQWIVPGGIF